MIKYSDDGHDNMTKDEENKAVMAALEAMRDKSKCGHKALHHVCGMPVGHEGPHSKLYSEERDGYFICTQVVWFKASKVVK